MSDANSMENIVPLFRTFEELQRDEADILKRYGDDWGKAYSSFKQDQAVISDDEASLIKLKDAANKADAVLAKSDNKLEALGTKILTKLALLNTSLDIERAKLDAIKTTLDSWDAAIAKCRSGLHGNTAVAKRSARFASAQQRPYYGPAAAILSIEAKRNG